VISLVAGCALLGLMFGSFANVLVYRLPRKESIVFPGSHCPSCGHTLSWYENIPLVSWLVLRGHCRHCDKSISIRYPLLELCLGLTWGYMAWHFGWGVELVMALILSQMLWVLAWIDLETGLLPDVITLPGIAIGIIFGMVLGHLQDSMIGAVAGYSLFWLVARVYLYFIILWCGCWKYLFIADTQTCASTNPFRALSGGIGHDLVAVGFRFIKLVS